jgi:hypothetical protein
MKGKNHVTCVMRLTVPGGASSRHTKDLLTALHYISTATRLEDGCLGCSVWTGPESSLHCVAEWATETDLRRWVRSDRFTSVLSVLESAHEPPNVRFDFVTETRGLDYVAEIRQDDVN